MTDLSADRIQRGVAELDGDPVVGVVLDETYVFDPDHTASDVVAFELADTDRLTATAAAVRTEDQWTLMLDDITASATTAARSGVYWLTGALEDDDETRATIGFDDDPAGPTDPYEPTYDDGFHALPIGTINARLLPAPNPTVAEWMPRVNPAGDGYELVEAPTGEDLPDEWVPYVAGDPESLPGWGDLSAYGGPPGVRSRLRRPWSVELIGLTAWFDSEGAPAPPPDGTVLCTLDPTHLPAEAPVIQAVTVDIFTPDAVPVPCRIALVDGDLVVAGATYSAVAIYTTLWDVEEES